MSISTRKSAQIWIGDFIIGIGVFFVAVLIFVVYLGNIADSSKSDIAQLSYQAKLLTSYLVDVGYPATWEYAPLDVKRVGITDGESRVQWQKVNALKMLNYSFVKQLLNTNFDFFFFIEDELGNVMNVGGVCGFGDTSVFSNLSAAKLGWLGNSVEDSSFGGGLPGDVPYYTQVYNGEEITNLYRQYKPAVVTNGMNASALFLYNLTQPESAAHRAFDIIYVEANTYNWSELKVIEDYVYNGGKLFLFDWWCNEKYEECEDGDSYIALGVNFTNTIDINYTTGNGFVPGIVNATVYYGDPYLRINYGLQLFFNGYPPSFFQGEEGELNAVRRLPNSSVFQGIAVYQNHTDARYNVDLGSFSTDAPHALAYWRFGTGWVYYFPVNRTMLCTDINTGSPISAMNCYGLPWAPNSYIDEIINAMTPFAGRCSPVNKTLVSAKHLVTTDRLVIYDDKFVKLVVYLWD